LGYRLGFRRRLRTGGPCVASRCARWRFWPARRELTRRRWPMRLDGELCGPGIGECCGSQLCVGDETQPSICVGFDGCLTDGKKNGLETDVDCGRTCRNRPCRAGRACDTMEDCADGLYCPRELRQCTPVPVDGVSCTARSTVSGSWVPRHSPDAPECGSGEACFFRGRHLCVSWGNCRMNQVECCDLGEGGRCYPLGTNQTCPQPRGWCGPRP
jgi:hypothetical protein